MRVSAPFMVLFAILGLGLIGYGWWTGLTVAPRELNQGLLVRIMFAHVPSAWVALGAYAFMAGASLVYFVWRTPLADEAAKAAAPMGAALAAATLITGSIWGKPTWGVWWAWDARMSSTLVLLLLYLGVFALRAAFDDAQKGARAASILIMVGAINLPIIKYSVEFWNTLHQPSGVFNDRFTDPAYQQPLFISGLGFLALFGAVTLLGMRVSIIARRSQNALRRARSRAVITQTAPTEPAGAES